MSAITEAKELSELIRKTGNIELERKILSLHGEVVELASRNRELEQKVRELEDNLKLQTAMVFEPPFYRSAGDKIPFCPVCWENNKKAIHLEGPLGKGKDYWHCRICNNNIDQEPSNEHCFV